MGECRGIFLDEGENERKIALGQKGLVRKKTSRGGNLINP